MSLCLPLPVFGSVRNSTMPRRFDDDDDVGLKVLRCRADVLLLLETKQEGAESHVMPEMSVELC